MAAAAYRSGQKLQDDTYGLDQDYTRRQGVLHTEIVLPKDRAVPDFAHDRNQLWNRVERAETWDTAQLAREIQINIPHELNAETRRGVVIDFAQHIADQYGFAVDVAIHAPGGDGDERNHHAHLLFSTRAIDADRKTGFAKAKDRRFDDIAMKRSGQGNEVEHLRMEWQRLQNYELARAGVVDENGQPVRVDRRSYERQGIDREATIHEGPAATALKRRGEITDRVAHNLALADRNAQFDTITRGAMDAMADKGAEIAEAAQDVARAAVDLYETASEIGPGLTLNRLQRGLQDDAAAVGIVGAVASKAFDQIADAIGTALDTVLDFFVGGDEAPKGRAVDPGEHQAALDLADQLNIAEGIQEQRRNAQRDVDHKIDTEEHRKQRQSLGMGP